MSIDKTMIGNPLGGNPEKPVNPKERIGFGIKYPSMVETPKMTPEEQVARAKSTREAEAQFMQSLRDKIGPMEDKPTKTDMRTHRKGDVIIGMKAPTPEEITAYKAAQKEAEEIKKKIKKGGLLSRLGKFLQGN